MCALSLIARKPGDRVKTDQRDARKLVQALRMNDVSAVHVPDAADEAFRDLVRVWAAARQDLAKAKQRLKSFLLVHDVRYAGTANWSEAHRRWLAKFVFKETNSQLAFHEHRHAIEDRLAQCERVERLLRESAPHWRFYPAIRVIQALRGVQFKVAVGLIAEIGEISRFASAPQLMAWLGMTPSEYSTGERRRQGAITKCGNAHARRLLVEAAWAYRYPPKVSPSIQQRHEGFAQSDPRSRLGCAIASVQTLPQAHRSRQTPQRGAGRGRSRACRLYLGHRAHEHEDESRALNDPLPSRPPTTRRPSLLWAAQPR